MPVQKIKSGRIITVQAPTYVGEKGTIFYDEDTPTLRLSDGNTPGGILFGTGGGGTFVLTVSEINTANTITNEVSNVSKIRFDKDTGFNVQDLGSGEVKVSLGSTFKTWKVSGQTDLVAQGEDTVEFKAGTGIVIVTSATSTPYKSMTISATGFGNIDGGMFDTVFDTTTLIFDGGTP
jgi:hypothetical protein